MNTKTYQKPEPKWIDTDGLRGTYNIKRGLAYELWWAGEIESVSLRRPGRKTGKRLFSVASIEKYLNSQIGKHDQKGNGKPVKVVARDA